MTKPLPLLAALFGDGAVNPWYKLSDSTREHVVVVGILIGATLALFAWVLLFRKRHHSSHHHHSHRGSHPAPNPESVGALAHKPRKRRRRRPHRPRNPTLAETGGLPPLRTPGPSGNPF